MDGALAGGGGGGGGALAFPVEQRGAEGQVAVAGGWGGEGFDLVPRWINPGQRLSCGRIVIEHFQKAVSKAGEVILNGIPQNQLIDGFIHVDNSINLELTFHG